MKRKPDLSVIVTTLNRRDLLGACLASLARQTASTEDYEVVVVVDGSSDGTVEMLGELETPFELRVIVQPRAGQSAARNAGARHAEGRFFLFVDDDEVASPALVSAHLQLHRSQDGVAGVGPIERMIPPDADRFARLRVNVSKAHIAHVADRPLTYLDCYGGNSSVSRLAFEKSGGYAVDLPKETDFEFAYRLNEIDTKFVFLPDAAVTEHRQYGWREIVDDLELRGRIAIELYRRHPAMLPQMELGGQGESSRGWAMLRVLLLSLNAPPRSVTRLGFLLPPRGSRSWFNFAYNYCYWYGARSVADPDLWLRLRRGTLILLYHAFGGRGEKPSRFVVPAPRFARQMAWLSRRGYNVISLDEYLSCRREYRLPPPKSVVVTIDDGYVDNDTIAKPILEHQGFPATVFLVTGAGSVNGWSDEPPLAGRPLISLSRAREIHGGAIAFGAHSRTHPMLTELEPHEAEDEVVESKRELERGLAAPVSAFAYPYGELNRETRELVARAGFSGACGVKPGRNRPSTDSFALNRVEIRGTYSLARFAAMLVLGDLRRRRRRGRSG